MAKQVTRKMDNTAPSIEALESEKRKLSVSKDDPKRLEEVKKKLDYFYYGIK